MPISNDMDILQTAFNELQYSYGPFDNDVAHPETTPNMSNYNFLNTMESQGMSTSSSPVSMTMLPPNDECNSNLFLTVSEDHFMNFNNSDMELLLPRVVILDQPVEKFRFRYKSEMMGTHGCLASASTTTRRKRHAPTVKLVDFVGQKAKIRCTLVTSDPERRMPHAHHLVKREGNSEIETPYEIQVSAENDFVAQFNGMGIIHTAKKNIKGELIRKMEMEALEKHRCKNPAVTSLRVSEKTQIKMTADSAQKWMNLNSVALCFQAFVEDENGVMKPITEPVYSIAINNLKSALTGELKICRIDKFSSPCEGGEEVFMLVEKVGKKNIKVKFFEVDENDHEIWSGYGRFSELDVHHQYAIVFKTPPYDREITAPTEVYIKLERPTDGDSSDPIKFTYKPRDHIFNKKRPRISYSGSTELSNHKPAENNLNLTSTNGSIDSVSQELIKWLNSQNKMPSDEYAKYLNSMDITAYSRVLERADCDSMLTTDGGPSRNNDATFAENLVHSTLKKIREQPKRAKEYCTKMFDERTTYGDTPLHSALRHGQREIVKCILMILASDSELKNLVHLKNSSGKTALHYAVLLNQPEVVTALLVLGANPNECDDRDFYPLHYAVKRPEGGACVDALLSQPVKLEIRDEAGWTPLQLAVEAGALHAVKSLIKAGADINETEVSYGRTVLHIAVENGHTDIVKYLLEETQIDVNKTNLGGNTALHSAVVSPGERAKEMCEILIAHGADPYIPNNYKESTEMEDTKNLEVSVKEELYCDESMDEDGGQTSVDLASNKPEILRLFAHAPEFRSTGETATSNIKEEMSEADDTLLGCLDTDTLEELAKILDKNRSWEKLAKHLQCEYILRTLDPEGSSPSMTILNYADIQGNLAVNSFMNTLVRIGDQQAVSYLKGMLNKRRSA